LHFLFQNGTKYHEKIITIADEILSHFDLSKLMASLAIAKTKKKNGNEESKESVKTLEKENDKVVDASCKKAIAIVDILESKSKTVDSTTDCKWTINDVDAIYTELSKMVDLNETRVYPFLLKHCIIHNHFGRALKLILKHQETKPSLELDKQLIEYCSKLNWTHCESHFQRSLHVKYPPSYKLF